MFGSGAGSLRPLLSMPLAVHASQRDKLHEALADLRHQFPQLQATLRVNSDPASEVIRLDGQSESQLEEICQRLRRDYALDCSAGAPSVILVETIRKAAHAEGKYIRQTGGHGNYGHVKIRLEPSELGQGFEFVNEIRDDAIIPKQFISSIREGIAVGAKSGILAGCEVIGFKAALCDGSYHETDSNEMAFRIAGSLAFKQAARNANPVVLEPVMALEIAFPGECMSSIVADLSARRGRIQDFHGDPRKNDDSNFEIVSALVPLREILGWAKRLSSLTQDRGSYTMDFARYETIGPAPPTDGDDAGLPVTRPSGRGPRAGASAADPEFDWT